MTALVFQFLVIGLFAIASAPALIENWRTGSLSNQSNLILFGGGLLVYAAGVALGHYSLPPENLIWPIGIAMLLLVAGAQGMVGGGVAKYLLALLPWLNTDAYLLVVAIGMFITAGIAKFKGGTGPVAPGLTICGVVALTWPVLPI